MTWPLAPPRDTAADRLHVFPHAVKRRESRHAAVTQFLVPEDDGGADGGWIVALLVAEPGADGELGPVGELHQQRAEPALVLPGAGLMTDDDGFVVLKTL